MATLVLVRHGQSQWNEKNLFTGWRDPDLTQRGVEEAVAAGQALKEKGIQFDAAFTSKLIRAQHTLELILGELNQNIPTTESEKLNERDYGDLSGKNKDEARAEFGEEQVKIWRRSFDVPPPGGESLKMTAERVIPYFEEYISPRLLDENKHLLIAAHGNSLRALVMHLEGLSPEEILKVEIATGEPIVYQLSPAGEILSKDVLRRQED